MVKGWYHTRQGAEKFTDRVEMLNMRSERRRVI